MNHDKIAEEFNKLNELEREMEGYMPCAQEMPKQELIQVVSDYISHKGLFNDLEDWLNAQGYTLQELGFK